MSEDDCNLFEQYLQTKQISNKEIILLGGQTCKELGFINKRTFVHLIPQLRKAPKHYMSLYKTLCVDELSDI